MGSIISKEVFDYLLDHLLDIHHKKLGIVSGYSMDYDSYTSKLGFLNSYVKGIEAFLEKALVEGENNDLPFVILGSVVYIRKQNNARGKIKIVLPKEQPAIDEKDVEIYTCFSDIGRCMLLKYRGDEVRVSGASYQIVEIVKNLKSNIFAN